MARLLIKNGRVWDGDRFLNADVLVEEDTVAAIEPQLTDDTAYLYDASGKIVSAGLVDDHVHLRVLPSDPFGIQAEMSCFPFGVTAAADAGRTEGNPAVLDSFMLKNVVFVVAPIVGDRVDLQQLDKHIAHFGDRAVGVKVYFDNRDGEVLTVAPLAAVAAFAKQRGLRVMVHSSYSPAPMADILNVLNPGDILTHAFHGGKNHAAVDNFESMKRAQQRGVCIDAGLAGHVHTDFAVFRQAIQAGLLPDIISTDITKFSAYTRGGRYGMTMCMSIARHLGMSEEDIFKAVTTTPAAALGKSAEWGSLKVGAPADIAVLEYTDEGFSLTDEAGNHVEDPRGYRCVLTVSDGQIVYKY